MNKITLCVVVVGLMLLPRPGEARHLTASWYSEDSLRKDGQYERTHGLTASGTRFDDGKLTAASWDYPLGTLVRVRHGGKSITVLINDRTARRFKGKRIDLSKKSFEILSDNHLEKGLLQVEVTSIDNKCSA